MKIKAGSPKGDNPINKGAGFLFLSVRDKYVCYFGNLYVTFLLCMTKVCTYSQKCIELQKWGLDGAFFQLK